MKICVLTSAHPPLDARIFYKEACSLRRAGYDVVLIAPYPRQRQGGDSSCETGSCEKGSGPSSQGPNSHEAGVSETRRSGAAGYPQEEIVEGIRIRYVPPFASRLQRVRNLRAIYHAAVEEQADLYHFHDPDLIWTGLTLQKKLGKPVIYDVHEYYADSLKTRYWLPAPLRKTAAAVFERLEKGAASRFAGIMTVNHHMEGLFKQYNPVGASLFNFPLQEQFQFERPSSKFGAKCELGTGPSFQEISEEVTEGADEEAQESFDSSDCSGVPVGTVAPVILYLGGINRERGLEVILEAMPLVREKHPDAVCKLVGPLELGGISEKYLPMENWLEKGNIQVLGKVPYSQVPAILRDSHIALVPLLPTLNYTKAIPVKLIEYMAAGLPVVGSRFGYIEQILREDECGSLAEPGEPQSLAQEICTLIENPAQALKYAQNGWDAFHEKYSWESEEKKLLAVYEQVLGGQ
ncbi:glycosyltransferase [Desulfitobacterium dichloroeliminans LMG P-21439]|uniref:Glycosyltransferase n=1 Tax=Desulfitobacterium dichloroeliminans (strain LMG P-21439 / DCA1) TaxID=871963 RepID=L0FCF4_DESDL|nr:glycosyltransferase family 4 protein [Desulfitobacterium dichloroeliminans]AGA70623.1 glycosyltransferase [Desulfitobacterium dichloroeliminans LMG P-21439]